MRPHVEIQHNRLLDTVHITFLHCTGPQGFIVSEENYRAMRDAMRRDDDRGMARTEVSRAAREEF